MKKIIALGVLFVCAMALTINAEAAPMVGFDGFTDFHHTAFQADVYWQVFAPGDAPASIGSNPYYTYTYQVYNIDGDPTDNPLTQFGVLNPTGASIIGGGITNAYTIAPVPFPPVVAPDMSHYGTFSNSAYWTFDPTYIQKHKTSYILWFKSPTKPGMVNGSINAGGSSDNAFVPGPARTPEPASMLLMGMGLVGFASNMIRRKFMA